MAYNIQFSRSVMSDSLWSHEPQHTTPPCPSPTPEVHPNPCPLSQWCQPTISSSVFPSPPALKLFSHGGLFQRVSSSHQVAKYWSFSFSISPSNEYSWPVLTMNIQDWFPLGLIGLISLQSKGLSRVFSNTTVQKHQLFSTQLSL